MELFIPSDQPFAVGLQETEHTLVRLPIQSHTNFNGINQLIMHSSVEMTRKNASRRGYIPLISKLLLVDEDHPDMIWLINENCSKNPKDKISIPGGHMERVYDEPDIRTFIDLHVYTLIRELVEEYIGEEHYHEDIMRILYAYNDPIAALLSATRQYGIIPTGCCKGSPLFYHYRKDASFCIYTPIKGSIHNYDISRGNYVSFDRLDYENTEYWTHHASLERAKDICGYEFGYVAKDDIRFQTSPKYDFIMTQIFNLLPELNFNFNYIL